MSIIDVCKEAESIPFSAQTIKEICNNQVNIVLYDELYHMNSIFDAFIDGYPIVLLYPLRSQTDGHWVCLVYHKKTDTIQYFDPYGSDVDYYLKLHPELYEDDKLTELLNTCGKDVVVNKVPVQKLKKDVSTCGRHCAVRAVFFNLTNSDYLKLMDISVKDLKELESLDMIVTMMTILNFG